MIMIIKNILNIGINDEKNFAISLGIFFNGSVILDNGLKDFILSSTLIDDLLQGDKLGNMEFNIIKSIYIYYCYILFLTLLKLLFISNIVKIIIS